jgi:hypothetical protein
MNRGRETENEGRIKEETSKKNKTKKKRLKAQKEK